MRVKVREGRVTCQTARRVARTLFNGDGDYHDGGYGYNSWWVVKGGWRGVARMDAWVMTNRRRKARIDGTFKVLSETATPVSGATAGHAGPERRFCGTLSSVRGDVLVEGAAACSAAKKALRDALALEPVGNSPGSPPGWECARITGNPPTGIACTRVDDSSVASLLPGPEGSKKRRRSCNLPYLYSNLGIAGVRTTGISCWVAANALVYWDPDQLAPSAGPPGYRCSRKTIGSHDEPGGAFEAYRCKRGSRRLSFNLGGG